MNSRIRHVKKDWGIFFTPQWVIDFMVNLIDESKLNSTDIKILEPACGMCQFLIGIRKNKNHLFRTASQKIGLEINKEVIDYIHENGLDYDIEIINAEILKFR